MDRLYVEKWLREHKVKNCTINEDLSVDVNGGVDLISKNLTELRVRFRNVRGEFSCGKNRLTSLVGCPEKVGGDFNCSKNDLTSLEGCPTSVGGGFYCYENQLTSLAGCPAEVAGIFNCHKNKLASLENGPKVVGKFYCGNNELLSLDNSPIIGYFLDCKNNKFNESDLFLYDYTHEQVRQYYDNKNLNIKLNGDLDIENDLGVKKRKI